MITSGRVRFHDALADLLRPIDEAQPHPENYNNGDLDAIGDSIDENGMCDVILVQASTGYIISGNHTWHALRERDAEVAPYLVLDVGDVEALKIMSAMNVIPRLAKPDNNLLLENLAKILTSSTLRGTGITEKHAETLEQLARMPMSFHREDWPMLTVRISPQMMKGFRDLTSDAETDTERFELLLRLAGWE